MCRKEQLKLNKNHFYTTEMLFYDILDEVKELNKWPSDLIDYTMADDEINLQSYEFDPHFTLAPGSNEGYYLNLFIRGINRDGIPEQNKSLLIGCIKTLRTDEDAVRQMAALYGELLISYNKVVTEHLDDMTRIGYDILFYESENEKSRFGYSECSKDSALKKWNSILQNNTYNYKFAKLRNNLTREITILKS